MMFSRTFPIVAIAAIVASSSCTALSLPKKSKFGTTTRSNFIQSTASAVFFADFSRVLIHGPSSAACADDSTTSTIPRYMDSEVQINYGNDSKGNPRSRATFVRRYTGDSTPYSFPPPRPIPLDLAWPEKFPFTPKDFLREDEGDDENFYNLPRLVYHIDEPAVASLTQYYRANIPPGSSILDICSSWVSHYPIEFKKVMKRISGTGINALELMANDQFTDYEAGNLNVKPTLPYKDNSFDVVTCVVSIDYLIHPVEVLKEVRRVLRPGGKVVISQSNRCFSSKAISMWLKMNDHQHLELINGYLKYAGFHPAKAFDITATVPDNPNNNPMYIVEAVAP